MGLGLRTSLRIEGQAMLVLGGPERVEFVVEFFDTLDDFLDKEILSDIVWEGPEFSDWPIPDEDCVVAHIF